MYTHKEVLWLVQRDPRYLTNIKWGEPRPGHPEGTIESHIRELEGNLDRLRPRLQPEQIDLLMVLIHVHDTFKPDAQPGVAIDAPRSHASLAAAFLREWCEDEDVLAMVRQHDEPYALWRQSQQKGSCNPQRLDRLIGSIKDWDTFLAFQFIDNLTAGKSDESVRWFIAETSGRLPHRLTADDLRIA